MTLQAGKLYKVASWKVINLYDIDDVYLTFYEREHLYDDSIVFVIENNVTLNNAVVLTSFGVGRVSAERNAKDGYDMYRFIELAS